jgi:hypothetical protein
MQIDEKTFLVNSPVALAAFVSFVAKLFAEKKYITFTWRIGIERSLDQNSLLHVWLTEYAAHLAGISKKQVTRPMIEHTKRLAKESFYRLYGYEWMVDCEIDPRTGETGKPFWTSSADYKTGEMFQFLTWLQMHAANDGCVLESRGQYSKLQREHEGRAA